MTCTSDCVNNVLFISLARNAVCVTPDYFHNAFFFRDNPAYQAIFDFRCRGLVRRDHWLNVRMFYLVNIFCAQKTLKMILPNMPYLSVMGHQTWLCSGLKWQFLHV